MIINSKFIVIIVLVISSNLFCDEWQYFSTVDRVNCQIIQGEFTWIGTKSGLIRYDRETNEKIHYNTFNSDLIGNYIRALFVDSNENLYIGTMSGFSIYDGSCFVSFDTSNSNLPHNWVTAFAESNNGRIWLGTGMGVVSIYNNIWIQYNSQNSSLTGNSVSNVKIDIEENIWVSTYNGGIHCFDGENWSCIFSGGLTGFITDIEIDSSGNIWAGTDYLGLICITDSNIIYYNTGNSSLPTNYIRDIYISPDNIIWIGTNSALLSFDGNDWITYPENPISYILSIDSDSDNRIWTGGFDGYSCFENDSWVSIELKEYQLPSNVINCLEFYESEILWVGTSKGICNYDGIEFTSFENSDSQIPNSKINDLAIKANGDVWIATDIGLSLYNGNEWNDLTAENSQLPNNNVREIELDSEENLWIACENNLVKLTETSMLIYTGEEFIGSDYFMLSSLCWGINNYIWMDIFDLESVSTLTGYFTEEEFIPIELPGFNRRIKTENNSLWFLQSNSVIEYNGDDFTTYNSDNSPLTESAVHDVVGKDNVLWFASDDLIKFKDNEWNVIDYINTGVSNSIRCIEIDNSGVIWLGGNGLVRYESTETSIDTDNMSIVANYNLTNYPNPFNPKTTFSFDLPQNTKNAKLEIFNVKGQCIKKFKIENIKSKMNKIVWNGKDTFDNPVSSGVYFYIIKTDKNQLTKKMLLLK